MTWMTRPELQLGLFSWEFGKAVCYMSPLRKRMGMGGSKRPCVCACVSATFLVYVFGAPIVKYRSSSSRLPHPQTPASWLLPSSACPASLWASEDPACERKGLPGPLSPCLSSGCPPPAPHSCPASELSSSALRVPCKFPQKVFSGSPTPLPWPCL